MAHDLLNINDNLYEYSLESEPDERLQVDLSEDDSLWRQLRHQHIASVPSIAQTAVADDEKRQSRHSSRGYKRLFSLGNFMKKQIIKTDKSMHYALQHMALECMKHSTTVNSLAVLEQNLALGTDFKGELIRDPATQVRGALLNDEYTKFQKIRVLLLYIFYKKGITKATFEDLIHIAHLSYSDATIVTNVSHLGIDIFCPNACKAFDFIPEELNRSRTFYKTARWSPQIQYVMEGLIDGTLSYQDYPLLDESSETSESIRSGYWCADKKANNVSQLVIFIAGGVTYSEMRVAYEMMCKNEGWDIIIGGDSILTPSSFMNKLKELPCIIHR